MSNILVRGGKPPFILTVDNAKAYFDPSSLAKATKKDLMGKLYKSPTSGKAGGSDCEPLKAVIKP